MIDDIILNYNSILFLACNRKEELIENLNSMDISVTCIDYDPRFKNKNNYICADFIFDNITIMGYELTVHWNCEKTYPLTNFSGDVVLIGDDKYHNGDCNPVTSVGQLIEQNKVRQVYDTRIIKGKRKSHYIVWGKI